MSEGHTGKPEIGHPGSRVAGYGEPLVIVLSDPAWPRQFAEIRGVIQRTIPGTYHSIEHVGSTSVPGLAAKPIIDIDVVMRVGKFERIKQGLESLGYVDEGDLGIPGRTAFYLKDATLRAALAPHHLYVVAPDSPALADHREFRDFMLEHPDWVERLNALKQRLAVEHADDREGYQRAKSPVVEEILRQARGTSPPDPLSDFGEREDSGGETATPSSLSGFGGGEDGDAKQGSALG